MPDLQTAIPTPPTLPFDVERIRADFPALHQQVHGHPLIYLDNAATSQKPRAVIDRLQAYYASQNSNVHRGVHHLSQRATDAYEASRKTVQSFLNAAHEHEVIFTRGTTEAVNLVAASYARPRLQPGDEILISAMEHHANIVPWQLVGEETGARLRVIPIFDDGSLDLEAFHTLLSDRTRLVALCYVSNTLGTINPVDEVIAAAHARGIPVLLDAAQAVPHLKVDVQALDCDFFSFSGHKVFGPTGIGVLYGKEALLDAMPPWMGGGDMIETVTFEKTTFNALPHKFEAGTPNIAGAIGMGTGLDYLNDIGFDRLAAYEHGLLAYATDAFNTVDGLRLIGTAPRKVPVLSFLLGDVHPYDAGTMLDTMGIAMRTGHHCTQPLMQRFGIPGTVRASFAFYNTRDEVDIVVESLHKIAAFFA